MSQLKGFIKLPRSVEFDPNLNARDKEVYCAIRSHRREHTRAPVFVSREKIASLLHCSIDVVKRSIVRLRLRGHIYWKRGGTGHANCYQFADEGGGGAPIEEASPHLNGGKTSPNEAASVHHLQETKNEGKNEKPSFRYGEYPVRVAFDGSLEVFPFRECMRWKPLVDSKDELFEYGELHGELAKCAAIADALAQPP